MRKVLIVAAGMILAAPAGFAQQPAMVIAYLDKTGDGKVDLNEYLTYQQPRLAEFDKDGDGELNLSEFRESLQGRARANANAVFKGANAEGGRSLTLREFLGYHAFLFKRYVDTNSDGFMSADEWQAIMAAN